MRTELKPCPCCGESVLLDRDMIFCDNCHLILRFDDYIYSGEAKDLKEAEKLGVNAWNSRVETKEKERLEKKNERLQRTLRAVKVDAKLKTQEIAELKDKIRTLYKSIDKICSNCGEPLSEKKKSKEE